MIRHRILFVCLGNICRSPLAEGVFRSLVREAGAQEAFLIESAGTGSWHLGEPPDARSIAAARERGLDISDQRARQVRRSDFETFDLLLAMDESNRSALQRLAPAGQAHKVHLLLDFAPELGVRDVPDPYYGGDDGFARALDLVEAGGRGLLAGLDLNVDHGWGKRLSSP